MLISRLLAKLFAFIAIFFLFWQTIYVNMIMEESVALSPYGLRPAYLHDKNYLIKNYLILIKQLIILLLNKKIHAKIPHSAKWQRPNGPSTEATTVARKSYFSDLKSLFFLFCYMSLRFLTIRILQSLLSRCSIMVTKTNGHKDHVQKQSFS